MPGHVKIVYRSHIFQEILYRGESKFEISTLSVNPTRRRGGQPFDDKDCNCWGVGGQTLASD